MTLTTKAGIAVAVVGVVLAGAGLAQIKSYTEEQFDRRYSRVDPLFGRDD